MDEKMLNDFFGDSFAKEPRHDVAIRDVEIDRIIFEQ